MSVDTRSMPPYQAQVAKNILIPYNGIINAKQLHASIPTQKGW